MKIEKRINLEMMKIIEIWTKRVKMSKIEKWAKPEMLIKI